jgi:hypothetical protein
LLIFLEEKLIWIPGKNIRILKVKINIVTIAAFHRTTA